MLQAPEQDRIRVGVSGATGEEGAGGVILAVKALSDRLGLIDADWRPPA